MCVNKNLLHFFLSQLFLPLCDTQMKRKALSRSVDFTRASSIDNGERVERIPKQGSLLCQPPMEISLALLMMMLSLRNVLQKDHHTFLGCHWQVMHRGVTRAIIFEEDRKRL